MTVTPDALRAVVRKAAELPYYAEKYRALDLDGHFDLADVPEMTRDDVTAAAEQAAARPRTASAFLFTSGGSTAEPKLAWIPTEMHLGALLAHWQPLAAGDVLANLATPGRLWSAHYFYNRVAEYAGADVIGLGYIPDGELKQWLDFLHRHRTTALAGTPSQLLRILEFCEDTGHPLAERLRAGIWFGEPCDARLVEVRDRIAPQLGFWGNYGSTETWVIGHNGPDCPPDTFHPLPYQHVDLVDGSVLVTTLHPGAVTPVIRYRIGDRAAWTACACGHADAAALRVEGREGALVKFAGTLVGPQQLAQLARQIPGVRSAQVALTGSGGIAERLDVLIVAEGGSDDGTGGGSHNDIGDGGPAALEAAVRAHLLASQIDLEFALRGDEDTFTVRRVAALTVSPQTGKTPAFIWTATV